jgi:23S rRNA (adenine2503-C2)-methyltransferase
MEATEATALPDVKSLSMDELTARFNELELPSYRVTQVLEWLYRRRATGWAAMTNLPKTLRESLAGHFNFFVPALVACQGEWGGTQKFLWRLADGNLIECVLLPANPGIYGEGSDRHTLCVSTQVGCAYGCKFCASGLEGWKRNLTAGEIVEQILSIERWVASQLAPASPPAKPDRYIDNLVIMGMGEPLANFGALMKALSILNAPWGGGIGARKITISTSGLAPQIRQLAAEPAQFRLAVSLHGATDEVRDRIMPVNRKYPLRELEAACQEYVRLKGKMISLEYILIAGVNDSLSQAKPLAELARRLHAKINLIPYNRVDGLAWERPAESAQEAFLDSLLQNQALATLRREKGHDIDAACGQLRLKTERAARAGV